MPFQRCRRSLAPLLLFICMGCSSETDRLGSGKGITIEMTGNDYRWRLRHAGMDGELNTADDVLGERNLRAPAGYPVHVLLRSDDYVYALRVPDLGVNQIAVPSLTFDVRFTAEQPGHFDYIADEMCGFQHETLLGKVIVVSASDYVGWLHDAGSASANRDLTGPSTITAYLSKTSRSAGTQNG